MTPLQLLRNRWHGMKCLQVTATQHPKRRSCGIEVAEYPGRTLWLPATQFLTFDLGALWPHEPTLHEYMKYPTPGDIIFGEVHLQSTERLQLRQWCLYAMDLARLLQAIRSDAAFQAGGLLANDPTYELVAILFLCEDLENGLRIYFNILQAYQVGQPQPPGLVQRLSFEFDAPHWPEIFSQVAAEFY